LHFAPDTVDALEFAVALCDTDPGATRSGEDELATLEQLSALLTENRYSGRVDGDEAELREVRATRDRIQRIWALDRDAAALEVNAILAEAHALPYLFRHDGFDWHLHVVDPETPLDERIAAETAMAMIDVIRSDEMSRLGVCADEDCEGLVLDLSRNRSKRFCSLACGNRNAVAAYRARQAAGA